MEIIQRPETKAVVIMIKKTQTKNVYKIEMWSGPWKCQKHCSNEGGFFSATIKWADNIFVRLGFVLTLGVHFPDFHFKMQWKTNWSFGDDEKWFVMNKMWKKSHTHLSWPLNCRAFHFVKRRTRFEYFRFISNSIFRCTGLFNYIT